MAILSITYNPETLVYEIEFDGDDPLQIITHGCAGEANTNQRHVVLGIIQDLASAQKSENTVALFIGDMSYTDKVAFTPKMLAAAQSKKEKDRKIPEEFFDRFYREPHQGLDVPIFLGVGNHDATGYFNRTTQKGTHDYDIAIKSTKAFCEFVTTNYPTTDTIKINDKEEPKWHQPNAYYGLHFTKISPDGLKKRILSIPIIDTNHIDRQPEQKSWLDSFLHEAYKKDLTVLAGHHPLTISSDRRVLKKDERNNYGFTKKQIKESTKAGLAYNTSARVTLALGEYSALDFIHLYSYAHHHYAEFIDPGRGHPKLVGSGAAAITLGAAEKIFNRLLKKPVCPGFPPGLRFNAIGELATCFLRVFPNRKLDITFRGYSITHESSSAQTLAQYYYSYDALTNQLIQDTERIASFKISPYFFTQHNNDDKLEFIRNILMLAKLQQWRLLKTCILAYMLEFNKKDKELLEENRKALVEFIEDQLPTSVTTNSSAIPTYEELSAFNNNLIAHLFNKFFYTGAIFNHLVRFAGTVEFCFRLMMKILELGDQADFDKEIPGLYELVKSYPLSSILSMEKQALFSIFLKASIIAFNPESDEKRKQFRFICRNLLERGIPSDQLLKTIINADVTMAKKILSPIIHHEKLKLLDIFSISIDNLKEKINIDQASEEEIEIAIAELINQRLEKVFPLKFIYEYSENLLGGKSPAP